MEWRGRWEEGYRKNKRGNNKTGTQKKEKRGRGGEKKEAA